MKRFIVLERRGRWLVIDTSAAASDVRSSHATQGIAQSYADKYNELEAERRVARGESPE